MKNIFRVCLFLFLTCSAVHAETAAEVGKPAPDFTLSDQNGQPQSLSGYRGKIVVLEWTNHECPYVKKHYDGGNMQALQKEMTAQGIVWLSVVSSAEGKQGFTDSAAARTVIEQTGAAATARLLDFDGAIGKLYGAKTTPHMFVIDKDGVLAYAGAIDDAPSADPATTAQAHNYVRAAVADLTAGMPVKAPVTNPYGCSVKYGD